MADIKVSEMTAATSVNSADVVYLVQAGADKKLSMATLLGNLPNTPARLSGTFSLAGTRQTLINAGAITSTQSVTILQNNGITAALTINNGTYDGQIKVILASTMAGTSTISSNLSCASVVFDAPGQSVQLMWDDNKWWPIGGTAAINF